MGLNHNKLKRNLLSSAQHFVLLERKLAQGWLLHIQMHARLSRGRRGSRR
jgi:hypothetical protein